MRAASTLFLSLAASVMGYAVTSPTAVTGWTNLGPQKLTWERVSSDRLNFTAVLINQQIQYSQVLASLVDGTLLTTQLNPPSAGWPEGPNFRVNLVETTEKLDSILAQSGFFNITAPNTTSSSVSGSRPSGTTLVAPANTAAGTNTLGASTSSASGASNAPPTPNAALPALTTQNGLLSALALMGLFLV